MSEQKTPLYLSPGAHLTKLQKRILSALTMIGVALFATWYGGIVFVGLALVVAGLMAWEWARMLYPPTAIWPMRRFYGGVALAAVAGAGLAAYGTGAALLAALVTAGVMSVEPNRGRLAALGVLFIALPVASLTLIRLDPHGGLVAIVFIFAVVWLTDTFAMIVGKAIGGPLLFPSISPNKTWAGAVGGLTVASLAGGVIVAAFVPSGQWWYGLVVAAVLSLSAQVGDMVESAVKRACKVKDTSGLIPGHGGVLDRTDSLVGASVAAALLALALNAAAPARALVTGG